MNSDPKESVEIIAELAQGFEGRPEQARLLLRAAAAAGADAAKFQLVYADELATRDYKHYDLFTSLEMSDDDWMSLARQARESRVALQVDVFGPRSVDLAERLNVGAIKLHPTDLANRALLTRVAESRLGRVLLGAGGAHAGELDEALNILSGKSVVVLLGFQSYPTPDDANQIARVRLLTNRYRKSRTNVTLGFADHADPRTPLRFALAAAAVGAGAVVIEKHLTLGRALKLEDHESALNPDEFAEFVEAIRGSAAGVGETREADDFGMSDSESKYRTQIRRHIVTTRALPKGTVLSPGDVCLKRTSAGEALSNPATVYTRTLSRDVPKHAPVLMSDLVDESVG